MVRLQLSMQSDAKTGVPVIFSTQLLKCSVTFSAFRRFSEKTKGKYRIS